jgi:hypothetical protein
LVGDAIKNTNLKIAHRTVAEDDRKALAGSMAMTEVQGRALITLGQGEAAVFAEGDDAPILVQVEAVKDRQGHQWPTNDTVAQKMRSSQALRPYRHMYSPTDYCIDSCGDKAFECGQARNMASDAGLQRTFARLVLSSVEDPGALDHLWPEFISLAAARLRDNVNERSIITCLAVHLSEWFASRRGEQGGWSYSDIADLCSKLITVLRAQIDGLPADAARRALREAALRLHRRRRFPYSGCGQICNPHGALCLYRHSAADIISTGLYRELWTNAVTQDSAFRDLGCPDTWALCQDAGSAIIEWPKEDWPPDRQAVVAEAAWRASLCFGQQMLMENPRYTPADADQEIAKLIMEAQK